MEGAHGCIRSIRLEQISALDFYFCHGYITTFDDRFCHSVTLILLR